MKCPNHPIILVFHHEHLVESARYFLDVANKSELTEICLDNFKIYQFFFHFHLFYFQNVVLCSMASDIKPPYMVNISNQ